MSTTAAPKPFAGAAALAPSCDAQGFALGEIRFRLDKGQGEIMLSIWAEPSENPARSGSPLEFTFDAFHVSGGNYDPVFEEPLSNELFLSALKAPYPLLYLAKNFPGAKERLAEDFPEMQQKLDAAFAWDEARSLKKNLSRAKPGARRRI